MTSRSSPGSASSATGQRPAAFDQVEMLARVKARRAQQQRERETCVRGYVFAPSRDNVRGDDAGNFSKLRGVFRPARRPHAFRRIDDRTGRLRQQAFGAIQVPGAEVGVANGVDDQVVRRQRRPGEEEFGENFGHGVAAVVDPAARRHIAEPCRNQQQQF